MTFSRSTGCIRSSSNALPAWLENVTGQLRPFLATNGGNIILLQPDNEPDTFEQVYLEQLGLGETPGMFQQFLHQAYQGDLAALNRRWGSAYHSFDEAHALMVESDLDESYRLRYRDFVAFRASYVNEVVRYYGEQYRQLGVDIPMFANAYDITNVQDFKALEETIGLVGIDSYPPNEFSGRFSPLGEDYKHRRLNEVWRSLRTLSKFAYLAEYQAGIAHGLHYWAGVMTPNHFAMASLTAIQAGVQAWNWFMLVNHDNFMMCPINEWGRKQGEHFAVFSEMTALYRQIDVPALQRVTDVSLLYNPSHQLFGSILDDRLLSTIYCAGIDYEFYNLETGRVAKPVMFYTGPRWLAAADQRKLLEYVEQGGDLVFCQTLPVYDDDNQNSLQSTGTGTARGRDGCALPGSPCSGARGAGGRQNPTDTLAVLIFRASNTWRADTRCLCRYNAHLGHGFRRKPQDAQPDLPKTISSRVCAAARPRAPGCPQPAADAGAAALGFGNAGGGRAGSNTDAAGEARPFP